MFVVNVTYGSPRMEWSYHQKSLTRIKPNFTARFSCLLRTCNSSLPETHNGWFNPLWISGLLNTVEPLLRETVMITQKCYSCLSNTQEGKIQKQLMKFQSWISDISANQPVRKYRAKENKKDLKPVNRLKFRLRTEYWSLPWSTVV